MNSTPAHPMVSSVTQVTTTEPTPTCKIVSTRGHSEGVWMPVAWSAEDALSKVAHWPINTPNLARRRFWIHQNRLARNVRKLAPGVLPDRMLYFGTGNNVFLFLMSLTDNVVPLLNDPSKRKWLYLFDTWQPEWPTIESKLRSAKNLGTLFFSSSQASTHFSERLGISTEWLPQAATSSEFARDPISWEEKDDLILNIGRVNDQLDEFFVRFAETHGFQYIRERRPGEVCFDSRSDFIDALRRAKIVVVHPRNLRYPEHTGSVSMLTARNFEAYQSSGIVCGFKPHSGEFDRVLGDMPFIEFESASLFEDQLLAALREPAVWIESTQKCRESHTWETRVQTIIERVRTEV